MRPIRPSPLFAYGCLTLSAVLTGTSLIFPPLWFLVFFGPALFVYTLLSQTYVSRMNAFWIGLLYGTVFNCTTAMSAWSVLPLDWVGIASPLLSYVIVCFIWLGASVTMGVAFGVLALGIFEMRLRGWSPLVMLTGVGFLWLGIEQLQAVLSSLFMLGAASDINAHFTLASIGYALASAQSEFWIASARWGGVPLLSLCIVWFSASIAQEFLSEKKIVARLVIPGFIVALFISISAGAAYAANNDRGTSSSWNSAPESLTVVTVQTDINVAFMLNDEIRKKRADAVNAVREGLRAQNVRPDVLVFPEGIGGTLYETGYDEFAGVLPKGSLLLHSSYPLNSSGLSRVLTRAQHIGGDSFVTEKQFLMPYGEYPPYHFAIPLRVFAPDTYRQVMKYRRYVSGTETLPGDARGIPVGARVCSEIFSPSLYRTLAKTHGAGLLVHTSSVGIFQNSSILATQMRTAARIRAVESGLPIVQAMNKGDATAFDCRGKELFPVSRIDVFNVYIISHNDVCPVFAEKI